MKNKKNIEHDNILLDLNFLNRLIVGIGEVSEITGVPSRKIRYWEDKGILHSVNEGHSTTRKYDYLNIKKIILIQELIDEGYTLDAAALKVKKRMKKINEAFMKLIDDKDDSYKNP